MLVLVDHSTIRLLEAVADRAWPPAQVCEHDGWELRATGPGIGRRVNSVAPTETGALPLQEKVRFAEAFYRARGLVPIIKLTEAAQPAGLDAFLAARGYAVDAPVIILTRALAPGGAEPPRLPAAPDDRWLEANAAVPGHYGAAPQAFLALLGRIAPPRAFAAVEAGEEAAAVGMAVADGPWVGLFEIGTRPGWRRLGLASAVVRQLLAWGAVRGATGAYLQVMEDNAPARALYERLGFGEAYRYWYRVAP
jgi:GNAT superfamily N-acetyltransferase